MRTRVTACALAAALVAAASTLPASIQAKAEPAQIGYILPLIVNGTYDDMGAWMGENGSANVGLQIAFYETYMGIEEMSTDGRVRVLRAYGNYDPGKVKTWALEHRILGQGIQYSPSFGDLLIQPTYSTACLEGGSPIIFYSLGSSTSLLVFFVEHPYLDTPQELAVDTSQFVSLQVPVMEAALPQTAESGWPFASSEPQSRRERESVEVFFTWLTKVPGQASWYRLAGARREGFLRRLASYLRWRKAHPQDRLHGIWWDEKTGKMIMAEQYETPLDMGARTWLTVLKKDGVEHKELDDESIVWTLETWNPLHVVFFTLTNGQHEMLVFKGQRDRDDS